MRTTCLLSLVALACLAFAGSDNVPLNGLSLPDTAGKSHHLADCKDSQATVFFFTAVECPTARRYLGRVVDLAQAYGGKGASFYAVYSNALEEPAAIKRQVDEAKLAFPALLDPEQKLADALAVRTTPTVVVVDSAGKVRYRGMIDENKNERLAKNAYLRDALESLLAGQSIAVAATEPVGCAIQRKLTEAANAPVTYANGVAGILHQHCATCHRPGQIAPFSLLTYEQARRWAANIKYYTQSRAMPPWKPDNHRMFRGERSLSQSEIETLAQWVNAGAPLGDSAQLPPPPKFTEGWALGTPDLVLGIEDEYVIEGTGNDEYRCFVLDPKLKEDRFVQAVEFRPGNPKIVHHVMTYIDAFGFAAGKENKDGKQGFASIGTGPGFFPAGDLGGWGPGMQPWPLDEGTARFLPRGAKIVMEVHYHKNGQRETDRTQIGLQFSKTPVKKRVHSQVVINLKFQIPAGAKRHEVRAAWNVPEDMHAVAVIPHMHLIGKEIQVTATLPDGSTQMMVHIPEWDFNWQETYHFKAPFALPKGSKVEVVGWFDNSAENPNNPRKPPRRVGFGEQTTDEMCVAYLAITKDKEE